MAVPALGQSTTVVTPAPPPREDTVGPEQLRNFSLGGSSSQSSPDTSTATAPTAIRLRPAASDDATAAPAAPRQERERIAAAAPASDAQPERARVATTEPAIQPAQQTARVPAAPVQAPATPPVELSTNPSPPVALPAPAPATPSDLGDTGGGSSSMLVWILLLIAMAGAGGAWWLLRHRGSGGGARPALAGGGFDLGVAEPPPIPLRRAPAPAPPAPPLQRAPASGLVQRPVPKAAPGPAPEPAARPLGTGGIVSSRLRPWVDLGLTATKVVVDDGGVSLFFDLDVINSGNAPARDIKIEAILINAGTDQAANLATFHDRPAPGEGGIEVIQPLGRMTLQSQVRLQREAVREYEVEGRKLFVPIVALQASYRWSAGEGRTSVNYLVGRSGDGDSGKMGPIRMDLGPRIFRGLEQRPNDSGIRR